MVILQAGFEKGEDLGRRLAGGADDEDTFEFLLVAAVCVCEGEAGCVVCADVLLLLRGPLQGLCYGVRDRMFLADARMAVERFAPRLLWQRPPDRGRCFLESSLVCDAPLLCERDCPCVGAAAGQSFAGGFVGVKRVPSGEHLVHKRWISITRALVRRV